MTLQPRNRELSSLSSLFNIILCLFIHFKSVEMTKLSAGEHKNTFIVLFIRQQQEQNNQLVLGSHAPWKQLTCTLQGAITLGRLNQSREINMNEKISVSKGCRHMSPLISHIFGSYSRSDIALLLMHTPATLEKQTALHGHTALLAQCEIKIQPKKTSRPGIFAGSYGGEHKESFQIINHSLSLQGLPKYDYLIAMCKSLHSF